MKRKTVEMMEARKLSMISGLYANTNLDEKEGARAKVIKDLEEKFAEAVAELYEPSASKPDPFEENFFKGMIIEEMSRTEIKELANPSDRPMLPGLDEDLD